MGICNSLRTRPDELVSCDLMGPPIVSGILDLLGSYGTAIADSSKLIAVGAVLLVLLALPWPLGLPRRLPARTTAKISFALISILGVAWAWHLRWLCDDAFISFRYARN